MGMGVKEKSVYLKQKLIEFVASGPPLQEMLKVFREKGNDRGQKLRPTKALEKE